MDISTVNQQNFTSGMNWKVRIGEKFTNPLKCEGLLADYEIESHFLDNKSAAYATVAVLKIFENLTKRIRRRFMLPPAITFYKKEQLIDTNNAPNFCIQDTKNVLKNDYPYSGRSLFFKNFKNLDEVDSDTDFYFKNKISSSSHFLSPFIHEWLHSFHLDMIYKKFGYGGECAYLKVQYPNVHKTTSGIKFLESLETKNLSDKENEIVYETLGEYATRPINQYLEVFSEAFTKFICDSLSGSELVSDPFDKIKNVPKEFKQILKKVCVI